MRYTAALLLLMFFSLQAAAQGYVTDGQSRGGMYPYASAGMNINEAKTGVAGSIGVKTYGKDYAPLGGQVEIGYLNAASALDSTGTPTSFLNFSFMGAVTTFRKYYNYHVAIGPSVVAGGGAGLYNFYGRLEGGFGYGKFILKAGINVTLDRSYSNLYTFTLNFYPTRKKTWAQEGK